MTTAPNPLPKAPDSAEYAVLYTAEDGAQALAYNPEMADPTDRADADRRARVLRTWQEDRDIPQDATLVTRPAAGGDWQTDPTWNAERAAWAERCAAADRREVEQSAPAVADEQRVAESLLPLIAHNHVYCDADGLPVVEPCKRLPTCRTSMALAVIRLNRLAEVDAARLEALRCRDCDDKATHVDRPDRPAPGNTLHAAEPVCARHARPTAPRLAPRILESHHVQLRESYTDDQSTECAVRYTDRRGRSLLIRQPGLAYALHTITVTRQAQADRGEEPDVVLLTRPQGAGDDAWRITRAVAPRAPEPSESPAVWDDRPGWSLTVLIGKTDDARWMVAEVDTLFARVEAAGWHAACEGGALVRFTGEVPVLRSGDSTKLACERGLEAVLAFLAASGIESTRPMSWHAERPEWLHRASLL